MVCFNQEERVAGLCLSFLEGDEMEGSRPSRVFGSIQIVPQGPHRTQGPVFFELSISVVVKAGIVTGDTLENLLLLVGFWL